MCPKPTKSSEATAKWARDNPALSCAMIFLVLFFGLTIIFAFVLGAMISGGHSVGVWEARFMSFSAITTLALMAYVSEKLAEPFKLKNKEQERV